jgi:hypothetical protein
MQEFIAPFIRLLLVEPIEERITQALEAARAPQAVIVGIADCTKEAVPILTERALSDPWWGVQVAFRLWIGTASADVILVEAVPRCRPAAETAPPTCQGVTHDRHSCNRGRPRHQV